MPHNMQDLNASRTRWTSIGAHCVPRRVDYRNCQRPESGAARPKLPTTGLDQSRARLRSSVNWSSIGGAAALSEWRVFRPKPQNVTATSARCRLLVQMDLVRNQSVRAKPASYFWDRVLRRDRQPFCCCEQSLLSLHSATDICNTPDPMFAGSPATLQNLPILRKGAYAIAARSLARAARLAGFFAPRRWLS